MNRLITIILFIMVPFIQATAGVLTCPEEWVPNFSQPLNTATFAIMDGDITFQEGHENELFYIIEIGLLASGDWNELFFSSANMLRANDSTTYSVGEPIYPNILENVPFSLDNKNGSNQNYEDTFKNQDYYIIIRVKRATNGVVSTLRTRYPVLSTFDQGGEVSDFPDTVEVPLDGSWSEAVLDGTKIDVLSLENSPAIETVIDGNGAEVEAQTGLHFGIKARLAPGITEPGVYSDKIEVTATCD